MSEEEEEEVVEVEEQGEEQDGFGEGGAGWWKAWGGKQEKAYLLVRVSKKQYIPINNKLNTKSKYCGEGSGVRPQAPAGPVPREVGRGYFFINRPTRRRCPCPSVVAK